MPNDEEVAIAVDAIVRQCSRLPSDLRLEFINTYSQALLDGAMPQARIEAIERLAKQRLGIK